MSTIQDATRGLRSPAVDLGFADGLDAGVATLLEIPAQEKLDAFDDGARFLFSLRGKKTRDKIVAALVDGGFPEASARDEVDMLPQLLSRRYLETILHNSAALPGGKGLLDGRFVPVDREGDVTVTGFPVGPVLIIGSGNAFVPAVASAAQALLCSCPVALRGSRLNQTVLELVVGELRTGGGPALASILEHLHLFFVDHRDPAENAQLHELLRKGPFGAGVFWGGREMLDTLLPQFALNPRHPVPIPMEPLTGVAVVTQRWLGRTRRAAEEAATELADAMVTMGQQMCSSPTEGYFVGSHEEAVAFARTVAGDLARSGEAKARRLDDRQAMLLDRVRERCEEEGATVLTPGGGAAAWTVVVSAGESVFAALPPSLALPIHDRHAFLELIAVPTLDAAAYRIARLPAAPCHGAIKQVQTVLRLCHVADAQRLVTLLRPRGGVFRVVPPDHVAKRHPFEPLDGQHFVSLFTRQTVVL
jgi:hypothetical protein